jgi:type III pantothenate kinase
MKQLLIDAGNSRIKWRFLPSGDEGSAGTTGDWHVLQRLNALRPEQIFVANVAGEQVAKRLCEFFVFPAPIFIRTKALGYGVTNHYDIPEQLGVDRYLALIAAQHLIANQHKLVIMAGTALTIDALDADGHFLGGSIAPGLSLMRESLRQRTAQLPLVGNENNAPDGLPAFALSTETAIALGTLRAAAGAITDAARTFAAIKKAPVTLIASGGDIRSLASMIEATCDFPLKMTTNLVLDGLAVIATSHAPHKAR